VPRLCTIQYWIIACARQELCGLEGDYPVLDSCVPQHLRVPNQPAGLSVFGCGRDAKGDARSLEHLRVHARTDGQGWAEGVLREAAIQYWIIGLLRHALTARTRLSNIG
jgi:hypothetical protein